jgi:hypothetical protein
VTVYAYGYYGISGDSRINFALRNDTANYSFGATYGSWNEDIPGYLHAVNFSVCPWTGIAWTPSDILSIEAAGVLFSPYAGDGTATIGQLSVYGQAFYNAACTVVRPSSSTSWRAGWPVTISWTALNQPPESTFRIILDGGTTIVTNLPYTARSYRWTIPLDLSEGEHTLQVKGWNSFQGFSDVFHIDNNATPTNYTPYPTDPMTRLTALTFTIQPGIFKMELNLGGTIVKGDKSASDKIDEAKAFIDQMYKARDIMKTAIKKVYGDMTTREYAESAGSIDPGFYLNTKPDFSTGDVYFYPWMHQRINETDEQWQDRITATIQAQAPKPPKQPPRQY